MPIAPKPYTIKCSKCNYTKRVYPKSDTDIVNLAPIGRCPKCGGMMERGEATLFDKALEFLNHQFKS